MFNLKAQFQPSGDQPQAIQGLVQGIQDKKHIQTLLGATGTGKTFTIANVIQEVQKPTLLISHNKTLAAQLATELKGFFPDNAVHYFVSYFDYYQPESYLPAQWVYIEKEATINQEIERYRLGSLASLLTRKDVIVVASVSSLYGLGEKDYFLEMSFGLKIGQKYDFQEIKKQLLKMQYKPVHTSVEHGMFAFKGERLDIYPSTENRLRSCYFDEEMLEMIEIRDFTTMQVKEVIRNGSLLVWPATQFLQDTTNIEQILADIDAEKEQQVKYFTDRKQLVEAERIKKRVEYDIRMIRETGFTNGIENYSRYFDQRKPWEAPNTIFDYFPEDMLLIIDESHMTIPQLRAMPQADASRKANLVRHGFRLPSAEDHRPVGFTELETMLGRNEISSEEEWVEKFLPHPTSLQHPTPNPSPWRRGAYTGENLSPANEVSEQGERGREWGVKKGKEKLKQTEDYFKNQYHRVLQKLKPQANTIFLSATPAQYELELSKNIVQQIIRPTGLLDPITYVYPKTTDYDYLQDSLEKLLEKKPYLKEFLDGYTLKGGVDEVKEVFE